MRGRSRQRTGLICGLALAGALAAPATGWAAPTATTGGLVPAGSPPDLFLLYTGDVIGYLDPCG